jgi:hypothetical protein
VIEYLLIQGDKEFNRSNEFKIMVIIRLEFLCKISHNFSFEASWHRFGGSRKRVACAGINASTFRPFMQGLEQYSSNGKPQCAQNAAAISPSCSVNAPS